MAVATAKLGPFLGVNNRLEPHALVVKDVGTFLAAATNVDLDNTGRLKRRAGFALDTALSDGHSLFSDGQRMLYGDGTDLVLSGTGVIATIADRVSYASINGDIYFTDGATLRRLDSNDVVQRVGPPVPTSLTAEAAAGNLQPATYQCTITYWYDTEEGGAYPSISITLESTGGIELTLPAAPTGVGAVGVYLSGPDGEIPLGYGVVAPGTSTVILTDPPAGRRCQTQNLGPMPAGSIVRHFNGRLLVAAGNALYYSESYWHGLTNPQKGYILFPEAIALVVPCVDGVYVVAGKTYWITEFGLDRMDLMPLHPYDGLPGSDFELPVFDPDAPRRVGWMSSKGLILADQRGAANNVQEKALKLALSGRGASVFLDGNRRIVSVAENG